jgi:hypothetical protein
VDAFAGESCGLSRLYQQPSRTLTPAALRSDLCHHPGPAAVSALQGLSCPGFLCAVGRAAVMSHTQYVLMHVVLMHVVLTHVVLTLYVLLTDVSRKIMPIITRPPANASASWFRSGGDGAIHNTY